MESIESPTESPPPSRLRAVIACAVLAALVWTTYANSLEGPFTFDDWHVIPQNPAVRDPGNIPEFFQDISLFSILASNRDYRPLFMTSMTLCWWAGDGKYLPFHLTSIALHMAVVLLLFGVLRRLLRQESAHPGGLRPGSVDFAAWLGAALFAVHPLATESVVYISSQSVPLAACFLLLSFFLFLRVYTGSRQGTGSWVLRVASWCAYGLALFSKPIAFVLPLVLVLWDLLLGRQSTGASGVRDAIGGLRKHLPFAVLSGLYLLVRKAVFDAPFGGTEPIRGFFEHALTQIRAIAVHYFHLAALPIGQNVDLAYPVSESIVDGRVLLAGAVCFAIAALLWRFRRHRSLVFWCLWFPAGFLITSYGVVLRQVTNEHRAYIPLVGFCAAMALVLAKTRDALPIRISDMSIGSRAGRALLTTLTVVLLVGLGSATHLRNRVWSSGLTLWENAAQNGGTWRAHMNYALALEEAGRAEESLFEFQRAVEIGPYAFAHLNLGLAYIRRGQGDKGLSHLRTATRLFPESPDTHLHLGVGLIETGNFEEAETELREALRLRPESMRARNELARLFEKRLATDDAAPLLREIVELNPKDVALRFRLAFALQKLGERTEAIEHYKQLLALDPAHMQGTFNLAYAYMKGESRDEWTQSRKLFLKTLDLKPDYHECLSHLETVNRKLGLEQDADR